MLDRCSTNVQSQFLIYVMRCPLGVLEAFAPMVLQWGQPPILCLGTNLRDRLDDALRLDDCHTLVDTYYKILFGQKSGEP